MGGAVPSLPQYAFMAWCSVSGSTGTILPLPFYLTVSRTALGLIEAPILRVTVAISVGVLRTGREADHSSPSNADFKYAWSYTSTPPTRLQSVVLS
jgi:hypothetical protein